MRTGNCKHFNGVQNQACDRGVSYKELTENHKYDLPCLQTDRLPKKEKAKCEKHVAITKEEEKAWEKECNERMKFTLAARALITVDSEEKGFEVGKGDVAGEVDCPKCGKKLAYERSRINGHVRAACSTADCLRWIE